MNNETVGEILGQILDCLAAQRWSAAAGLHSDLNERGAAVTFTPAKDSRSREDRRMAAVALANAWASTPVGDPARAKHADDLAIMGIVVNRCEAAPRRDQVNRAARAAATQRDKDGNPSWLPRHSPHWHEGQR